MPQSSAIKSVAFDHIASVQVAMLMVLAMAVVVAMASTPGQLRHYHANAAQKSVSRFVVSHSFFSVIFFVTARYFGVLILRADGRKVARNASLSITTKHVHPEFDCILCIYASRVA